VAALLAVQSTNNNKLEGSNPAAVDTSGLYLKHMTIVNDDFIVIIKCSFKLIDAAEGVINDHHMFIVQATVEKWPVWMAPSLACKYLTLGKRIQHSSLL
jgi:hypothetical protein